MPNHLPCASEGEPPDCLIAAGQSIRGANLLHPTAARNSRPFCGISLFQKNPRQQNFLSRLSATVPVSWPNGVWWALRPAGQPAASSPPQNVSFSAVTYFCAKLLQGGLFEKEKFSSIMEARLSVRQSSRAENDNVLVTVPLRRPPG